MNLASRHERLRFRAELLAKVRQFFVERGFLEVETPLVDDEIIPELHIEPFEVLDDSQNSREPTARRRSWLQSSPELHMKRLLAEGLPAIFQVTRSFRRSERGKLHNPEFTILEWYRAGDDYEAGMTLLGELVAALAPDVPPAVRTTYAAAFERYIGVDPHRATFEELAAAASRPSASMPPDFAESADRDEWLNLLLATIIEPQLGAAGPEILCDYPASQSALATTAVRQDGYEVAERFELYWQGVELANGYRELCDATALRARLVDVDTRRAADGRRALPLPERLLAAMEGAGLPPCSGCALGFDRLAMVLAGATTIDEMMAFPSIKDTIA